MLCLELLIEVLSTQPSALLPDLIHLMTKNNLMKARNDVIDSIGLMMTNQRDREIQKRQALGN